MSSLDASLSHASAYALSVVVASSYLVAVFVSQLVCPSKPPLWRNRFEVVRARMVAVSISSLLSCVLVGATVQKLANEESSTLEMTLRLLGLPYAIEIPSLAFIKPYLIIPILFLGPLYAQFLSQELPFQAKWSYEEHLKPTYLTFLGMRNHVLAPITEEVTYRACVLSFFKLGGISRTKMIWLAPCWFGVAHLHHMMETCKRLGKNARALKVAILQTAFQFCYTTVFGWLCSFLFMRTGSLLVVIAGHSFCNTMGFPRLTAELQEHPSQKITLLLAYFLGVGLFAYVLFPLTDNPDSIYWS
ncbi:Abi-domain-containing protein [Schizopora paradoxa]|uniref:intramembrane prenyl-peptidase Rce1 n=1 Tax=Schizopora paradoxa TaxID=27342 RepID=A0A0H2RSI1_9AGAM|nr:Abi-domain-containing protein [Schizopora paradoxa]